MTCQAEKEKVDAYLLKHQQWHSVLNPARQVLLESGLVETVKWGAPAYTLNGKNLISMMGFKHHCALWFHHGFLLRDTHQLLAKARERRARGMRQWRFEAGDTLPIRYLQAFIIQTIANHNAGKGLEPRSPSQQKTDIPDELAAAMAENRKLQKAFVGLTPGRQREYANHIASAKQKATRLKRLEKAIPLIEQGVGLHDKYRNC